MEARTLALAVVVAVGTLSASARPALAESFLPSNCGAGLLSPELETLGDGGGLTFLYPVDVEGDGVPDQVSGNDSSAVVTYRGGAVKPDQLLGGQGALSARVLLVHDLDRNAGAELVVARAGSIDVLHADATGALTVIATATLAASSAEGVLLAWAGHFRRLDKVDLLFGDTGTGALSLFELSGPNLVPVAGVAALASTTGGALAFTTVIDDMDGDGLDDVAHAVAGGAELARLGERASWDVFQTFKLPDGVSSCAALAAGDFDGDGRADLVVEPESSGGAAELETWLQTAAGSFTPFPAAAASAWAAGGRILVGDVDADGADDFVTKAVTAHWVGGAWRYAPSGFDELFDLSAVHFAGLELTARDAESQLVRARAAHAHLGIELDAANSKNDTSGPTTASMTITNSGPTATRGLAFTTNLDGATFEVTGCTDTAGGCPDLVMPSNSAVFATLRQDRSQARSALDVSVCTGAPDPKPSDVAVHAPLTTDVLADLGANMAIAVMQTGEFGATAYVSNGGPAFASDLRLSVTVEPPQPMLLLGTEPTNAVCASEGSSVTCTLDLLEPGGVWWTSVKLVYYGKPLTVTTTVSSSNPDPDPSRNTYVLTLPGGLKPAAPSPSSPSSSGAHATDSKAGCSCRLERESAPLPLALPTLAVLWLLRRRRSRRQAGH